MSRPRYEPGDLLVANSALPGIAWPTLPPAQAQAILSLVAQLDRSQWWSPERLQAHQLGQARLLLDHARRTTSWYGERLAGLDIARLDAASWLSVPVLTRRDLQANAAAMQSRAVPPEHGKTESLTTSGSTGMPVTVVRTSFNVLLWTALTVREVLWHRKDVSSRLAIIRHGENAPWPKGKVGRGWAPWAVILGPPGEVGTLDITTTVDRQLDWLASLDPTYLLTYPTNLGHLVEESLRRGVKLKALRAVTTLSELLRPELRDEVREHWGVPIQDLYSAQEVGYIGLQCPDHEHHHVQSECMLVEVLDDRGQPCKPGEVGRVVVTALHTFAMPLVRYEIGDLAEVGPPCPCGRGLPVLARVLGRVRNSLITADGRRFWPHFGTTALLARLPIVVQHQIVQTTLQEVEVRVVLARDPDPAEDKLLAEHFAGKLPDFQVRIVRVTELPRSKGGKFEDVMCLVRPS